MFLQIQDLVKEYPVSSGLFGRQRGVIRALDHLSLDIYAGEILGLIGEAGCGKSTLAKILLRFLPATAGQIHYNDKELLTLSDAELRALRPELQIIFSNPYASINPRMTVFEIVAEPLILNANLSRSELKEQVADLLLQMGLKTEVLPHSTQQLKPGQAQRVVLARAIAMNPKLLVLDEPTANMQTSEAQAFNNLLKILQRRFDLTILYFSEQLEGVELISDRIAVMHMGEIVELGGRDDIVADPQHPYTQALFSKSIEPLEKNVSDGFLFGRGKPAPQEIPAGCRFHPRCPKVMDHCRREKPIPIGSEARWATCHLLTL